MEITIRLVLPRIRRRVLVTTAVAVVAFAPTAAFASHLFSDVPNSHTFHGHISAIEGAGITHGCGDGKFCPEDPITRGQEAAFLERGLGRAASSTVTLDTAIAAADGWVAIAGIDIDVPGVEGGLQQVVISGEVTAVTDPGGLNDCGAGQRCYVNARIRHITSGAVTSPSYYAFSPNTYHQELIGRQGMFTVASGNHRFELQVDLINASDLLQFTAPSLIGMTFALSGAVAP